MSSARWGLGFVMLIWGVRAVADGLPWVGTFFLTLFYLLAVFNWKDEARKS